MTESSRPGKRRSSLPCATGCSPWRPGALGDQARLAHDAQMMGEGRLAQLEPGLLPDLGAKTPRGSRGSGRSPVDAGRPARPAPGRAEAAAGILTTTQQFGVASGVAVIGAVFYTRLGITRASSVTAMELAMAVNAVVVLAAVALTLLLPRRAAAGRPAVTEKPAAQEPAEYSAGAAHLPPSHDRSSVLVVMTTRTDEESTAGQGHVGVITTLRAEFSAAFLKTS